MSGTPKTVIKATGCVLSMLPDGSARLSLSGYGANGIEVVIAPAAWKALGESAAWFVKDAPAPEPKSDLEERVHDLEVRIDYLTAEVPDPKKLRLRR
jgi:hypothetical protein